MQTNQQPVNLDEILENMVEGFVVISFEWKILFVNKSAEIYIGKSRELLLGQHYWSMISDLTELESIQKAYHQVQENKHPVSYERFNSTDGSWHEVNIHGHQLGLFIYFKDITQRRKQELELLKSQNTLNAFFNSSSDVTILVDKKQEITAFNKTAKEKAWEHFRKRMKVGLSIHNFITPSFSETFIGYFIQALSGKQTSIETSATYTDNSTVWWSITFIPILDQYAKITGVAYNLIDITHRKQAEQHILRQNEQLREIANIQSHVIRRPVANIIALLHLHKWDDLPEAYRDTHNLLLSEITTLDEIILQVVQRTAYIEE